MITLNTIATAAGSQQFAAIVKETLCKPFCINQTLQPIPSVTYALGNVSTQGTITTVELIATGTITYVPRGYKPCNTIVRSFSETTTLMFVGTGTPTVTITQGQSVGQAADVDCNKAKAYQIATDVTVTATFA